MNDSAIVAKHSELFPNYVFTDVETSLDLMAAEIHTLRMERCEVATHTVGISGASAAMQDGGMPRWDQNMPDATSPEQPIVCPCCNNVKRDDGVGFGCDCFGTGCPICQKCQGHCAGPEEHTPERICMVPQDQITLVDTNGHDVIGTLEMDDRQRIAFCRADGAIIALTDETDLDTIFAKILRCRAAQDAKWGGPEHDDAHTRADWCQFIQKFRNRAESFGDCSGSHNRIIAFEENMIHVASLAIAAIESSRRKRAGMTSEEFAEGMAF